MFSGPGKLIFVAVLAINCVLWSHGRYGRIPQHSGSDLGRRFSKRDIFFGTGLGAENVPLGLAQNECRPLAFPTDAQCRHVQDACEKPETFLRINYLQHYFCSASTARRAGVFVGLLIWLIFLFSTLGISASDFFTPNLATIAQLLGLDENVAGVTFLALGNGSPDVFSTFSAMRANSGSLAIGELLGAASFIVSCVVGSMCIIKPFRVNRVPFLRDVGFFTSAVALLLVILWDGRIMGWEAGILIVLYVIYVATVCVGTWWEKRQMRKYNREAVIRAEYASDEVPPSAFYDEEPYRDDPASPSRSPSRSPSGVPHLILPSPSRARAISVPTQPRLGIETEHLPRRPHSRTPSPTPPASTPYLTLMPSFSLVGALEFRQVVSSLQHEAAGSSLHMFDSPITPYAGGHYHRPHSSRTVTPTARDREQDPWDAALGSVRLNDRHGERQSSEAHSIPTISRTPASPTSTSGDDVYEPPSKRQRLLHTIAHIYHVLLPSLHHFRSKSFLGKVASLFAVPAIMALTLTLPVIVTAYDPTQTAAEKTASAAMSGQAPLVDFEEEGVERALIAEEEVQEGMHEMKFNKWLMATQCALGPLFCAAVLFSGTKHEKWVLIGVTLAGVVAAVLVALLAKRGEHPAARMARCSMGFFVAVVWIMAIADEVVNVLKTFGFIFGLSDAIIGLTIFAVGNSLADLVANMSVAVFAPIMGFSACFGGPMLNILLGVGVSGTYIISQTAAPYDLHFSKTLFVSTIGLLALLIATLAFVPLNAYMLTRRWGIFLIAAYGVLMTVNVVVELRSDRR